MVIVNKALIPDLLCPGSLTSTKGSVDFYTLLNNFRSGKCFSLILNANYIIYQVTNHYGSLKLIAPGMAEASKFNVKSM